MLRAFFIYLSHAAWARSLITGLGFARRAAARFVAGDTVEAAIAAIRALNAQGLHATVDHLGENVTSEDEARRAADDYIVVLDRIAESGVRSNISVKLTQFGLDINQDFCVRNVRRVIAKARDTGNFVRIDMEGTPHTDRTLQVLHAVRQDASLAGHVGTVLQAYLYRTEDDLCALTDETPPVRLRLCKGAYNEPPDKAFPRKADVDANFARLTRLLLDRAQSLPPADAGGRIPPLPAIATHDEKIIQAARAHAAEKAIPREYFEFQMLYGIRRDLQERLAAEGYAVRVYVPYGTHWYPYFMRRLAERPANVWFFLFHLFRR
jgi:proline dehydrogenase